MLKCNDSYLYKKLQASMYFCVAYSPDVFNVIIIRITYTLSMNVMSDASKKISE